MTTGSRQIQPSRPTIVHQGVEVSEACWNTCPAILEWKDRENVQLDFAELAKNSIVTQCAGGRKIGETESTITRQCRVTKQLFVIC